MQFISKYKQHRIVVQPDTYQIVGINRQFLKGKDVQFENNEYETDDQEIIDFLLNCDDMQTGVISKMPSPEEIKEAKRKMIEKLQKEVGEEKEEFVCDVCGKVCKSELGLKSHKRVHNDN